MSARNNYELWTIPQVTLTTTFQTVWQQTAANIRFYEAIWHVSSDDCAVRVEVDGEEILSLSMSELSDDFKVGDAPNDIEPVFELFSIMEYKVNRWRFRPPFELISKADITIQMKAESGTKTLYRGLSVWGVR